MKRPIQLHIPTPCHEDWAGMEPAEQGRHCQSCQKTVVDFTTMSDQQVLNYLAKAGPHICGRLASDQINRSFIPLAPPQRNGWSGWRLLLAGALITSTNPPLKTDPPAKLAILGDRHPKITYTTTVGMVIHAFRVPKQQPIDTLPQSSTELRMDSSSHTMGEMATVPADSTLPAFDTLRVFTNRPDSNEVTKGAIAFCTKRKKDSVPLPASDTLQNIVTTVRSFVTDTLTALRVIPAKKWQIYPNPLPRGNSLHLSWQTASGRYQVTLLSATGALIQERAIDVGGPGQVDVWNLSSGLPGGVYILRATRPGQTETLTRELVVE